MLRLVASSSSPMRVWARSAGSPAWTAMLLASARRRLLSASSARFLRAFSSSSRSAFSLSSSAICALSISLRCWSLSALTSVSCLALTSPTRLDTISSIIFCCSSVKAGGDFSSALGDASPCVWAGCGF